MSPEDLRGCGFSTAAVRRRVSAGEWQRLGRAILLLPSGNGAQHRSDETLAWASHITYGPASRISGALALRRAGWTLPVSVNIVVVPGKPHATLPGTVVLRRPDAAAQQRRRRPRYLPGTEALLDCFAVLDRESGEGLLDAALQKRAITPAALEAGIARRLGRGKRGAVTLRALLRRASTGSRSEAEQRMGALLRRSGTGAWTANLPVYDALGRMVAEIDFAHEGMRIAIEVDGRAHHTDRQSFERDRERQNLLTLHGWLVLRFTWEQITLRPAEVIGVIRSAVHQRAA